MRILGIETSCDETAAAVVEEIADPKRPWVIRSNVVASQVNVHREWGGVVPELASRQHVRDICGVIDRALADAPVSLSDLDAIAVTRGPGLVGSLLVGVSVAKSLAYSLDVPLVPVHHLAGHIESIVLEHGPIPLPAVVLVVSGGHTSVYEVRVPGEYRLLGRTRDDAAGEAYDKVAKILGLGYPGGPIIDRLAREGDDRAFDFPVARFTDRSHDFSFSGLKTAVLRQVKALGLGPDAPASHPGLVRGLAASFQRAVIEALLEQTFEVAVRVGARAIGIAGGVSANSRLRADARARGEAAGLPVFVPSPILSTDNAAMIAAAGLRNLARGITAGIDLNADANLELE